MKKETLVGFAPRDVSQGPRLNDPLGETKPTPRKTPPLTLAQGFSPKAMSPAPERRCKKGEAF